MRAKNLKLALEMGFQNNWNMLIKGAPGVGKSDIVEQAANACKHTDGMPYDLLILHPVVQDPTEGSGLPWIVDGKAVKLPLANLKKMIDAQRPLVVFLDDLGQATPAVQAAYMQLLLARQIDGQAISEYVRFVAATNRREDRSGVTGLLEAVKSRFASILSLEANAEDWIEWALKKGLPKEIIGYIQFRPQMLHNFKPSQDIENYPCPRTVHNVGRMIGVGLPNDLRFEMIKGAVGEAFAVEFEAFVKTYMYLPSVSEIEMNPSGATVPTEISAKFAVASMLSTEANDKNIGAFIQYLSRLNKELELVAVKNAFTRNPMVANNPAFRDWGIRNGQMLTQL